MAGEALAPLRGPGAVPAWALLALEGRRLAAEVYEARHPTVEPVSCPPVTCEAPDFDEACDAATALPYARGLVIGGFWGLILGASLVLAGVRCARRDGRAAPRRRGGGMVA